MESLNKDWDEMKQMVSPLKRVASGILQGPIGEKFPSGTIQVSKFCL